MAAHVKRYGVVASDSNDSQLRWDVPADTLMTLTSSTVGFAPITPNQAPVTRIANAPVKLGSEILVNTATADQQAGQKIVTLADGGFVVTWFDQSAGVGGAQGDTSSYAIKAQVFNANGSARGTEVLVNTTTAGQQLYPIIMALGSGFVVSWNDTDAPSDPSFGIRAQVFDANGAKVGSEQHVNTATASYQSDQQMTALSNGGFVVTWGDLSAGVGGATGDSSGSAVKAQLFAANGAPVGSEFLVNTATTGAQDHQQITALVGGGFVVTWTDASRSTSGGFGGFGGFGGPAPVSNTEVRAQIYSNTGARVGGEVAVNTTTTGDQGNPHVTSLSNGGFVVTWSDSSATGGDTSDQAIRAQVFSASGALVGSEFLVNTATNSLQFVAQVTSLVGGGFVVTWTDYSGGVGGATGDTSSTAVKAQVYDAGGVRIGTELLVNSAIDGSQQNPTTSALPNGGFVVAWEDYGNSVGGAAGDPSYSVKAQAFSADGTKIGTEQLINTAVVGSQYSATVTALNNGDFAVAWTDNSLGVGGATGDTSSSAIKAQVFTFAPGFTAIEQVDASLKGRFSASDADAGTATVTATVSAAYGVINATAGTSGVTIANSGTAVVTLTGTLAQINAFLANDFSSTLAFNANTDLPPASTTVTFTVNDGGNTGSGGAQSSSTTTTVAIAAVNDAPTGSDRVVATVEETPVTLHAADFGFADAEGNSFTGIVFNYANRGTLSDNGVQLYGGETVSLADITAGKLVFTPGKDVDGPSSASIAFQVQDDGGTANGGVNTDASANTLNFDVAGVNDAPVPTFNTIVRVGSELLVNSTTFGSQYGQQVAVLANGGFVVTWFDNNALPIVIGPGGGFGGFDAATPVQAAGPGDPDGSSIKAQVYAADGTRVGGELLVNTSTAGNQNQQMITALSGGGFVVAWTDANVGDVKAQVFGADGSRVGGEFTVNTATASIQDTPAITALSNGGFVVTWEDNSQGVGGTPGDASSYAIKAQIYTAAGAQIGIEVLVNTATSNAQQSPIVTALAGGGFAVAWTDGSAGVGAPMGSATDSSGNAIKVQAFAADGSKIGTESLVETTTAGYQFAPHVVALSNGGYVVSWDDYVFFNASDPSSVRAQVYAANGSKLGGELTINTATDSSQNSSVITALASGGFVVTWTDSSQGVGGAGGDTSDGAVKAQIYAADGTRVGGEVLVNTATAAYQGSPQITALPNGGFVVAWQDYSNGVGGAGGDTSDGALKAQAFAADGSRIGTEFLVNTATAGGQYSAVLKTLANGDFVVTWVDASQGVGGTGGDSSDTAIKAQVFHLAGGFSATDHVDFSLAGRLSANDVDGGTGTITAIVSVGYGKLTALAGSTGAVVSGSGTGSLTISGTLAQVNALLSGTASSTFAYNADTDTPPSSTTLSFTINDNGNSGTGGPLSATATQTIAIVVPVEVPHAHGDSATTTEAAAVTIAVLANDGDPNGAPAIATVNGVTLAAGGSTTLTSGAIVMLNSDGTLSYDPHGGFNYLNAQSSAVDSFAYTLTSGSTATVSVTVTGLASAGDANHGGAGNDVVVGSPTAANYVDLSQGGDDTATGGSANDGFFFGAAFTGADRVDGGAGTNDQIGLQGNYTGGNALVLQDATITGIEMIAALAGYSYDISTVDANVAAGQTLTIYGSALASGNDLTFNGSAETDGMFRVYGGLGKDTITTGGGNDGIYFGAGRFTPGVDHVDAGGGTNDQMALDGNYTVTISRADVVNVETLVLLDGQPAPVNYVITLADDWTQGSEVHTVYAVTVRNGVTINGSAETDSALRLYGGAGNDTLTGGADTVGGSNWFDGGAGSDTMKGGAGVDTFYYGTAANSMGVNYDHIVNFNAGQDKITLPFAVTAIDGPQTGALSTASFDSDLTNALATLGAHHAVQFTANSGSLSGHIFEVIDANGVAGYQAGQDMVIELVTPTAPITTTAPFL